MLKALGGTKTLSDNYMPNFQAPELFRQGAVQDIDFSSLIHSFIKNVLQNYYM